MSICAHYGRHRGVPPPDRALPALRVDSRAGPRPTPANPTRKRAGNPLQGTPRRYARTDSTKTKRHGLEKRGREGRRQGSRAGPIRRTCDAGTEGRARESRPEGSRERAEAQGQAARRPSGGGRTNGQQAKPRPCSLTAERKRGSPGRTACPAAEPQDRQGGTGPPKGRGPRQMPARSPGGRPAGRERPAAPGQARAADRREASQRNADRPEALQPERYFNKKEQLEGQRR